MAALAQERLTDFLGSYPGRKTLPMKAATTIYKGALVAIDASGNAQPAGSTAGGSIRCLGVASATMANPGGAGAQKIEITPGIYKFLNKGGDLVTAAMVGADCYVEDDQTVRLTATGAPVAGKVVGVDSDGVRVLVGMMS